MNIPNFTQAARKYAIALALILVLLAVAEFAAHLSSASAQTYRNDAFHFSVRIPRTYTSSENTYDSGLYRIIYFSHGADDVVQLILSPWSDSGSVLTKESVIEQYPYVGNAEALTIAHGVIGLVVHNDPVDPAAISGIWFAYKGNLYQFDLIGSGTSELLPIVRTLELH